MCMLIVPWVLVVFCLRCRARVAPPVDETEDELSFQDEFLPQSCQLGVGVEVELDVDLVLQVVVDREVYETMNPQRKTI